MEMTELEKDIGHIFIDKKLLERALTTNGWVNEHGISGKDRIQSQETFCTLGDAVLKLILVNTLVVDKGIEDSGTITEEKKDAENRTALSRISRELNVGKFMIMGKSEREHDKIFDNDDNLAETLEALIGAIYLAVGFHAAKKVIMKWPEFERFVE
jgi:dsRNA-specific ribonuclease